MVFRGKPSGACLPCRRRRIKCDQNTSGCKSCKRAGIECHGYRTVPQTMFYHETDVVISKNQSPHRRAYRSPPQRSPVQDVSASSGGPGCGTLLGRTRIQLDMDDFAFNYFRAYSFLLPSLETSRSHDMLMACMKAHGLATCAVAEDCYEAKVEARRHYLAAIQQVNNALTDGYSTSHDDVLLAAMMLGTIETISDSRRPALDAWASHVQGCSAILNVRGAQQVRSSEGRLLFMQAAACLMSQCLFSSSRMPEIVQTLTDEAFKNMAGEERSVVGCMEQVNDTETSLQHSIPDKATWAMHQALMTLTNVNSDMKRGHVEDSKETAKQVLLQDAQLNAVLIRQDQMSKSNNTELIMPAPTTYEEAFDQYLLIQTSNSMRSCRMLLHVMYQQLLAIHSCQDVRLPGHPTTGPHMQASTKIVDDMRSQILTSIPYQVQLAQQWLDRQNVPTGLPNLRQLLSPPAGVSTAVFVAAEQILTGSSTTQSTFFTAQDPPILRISHGYNVISALLLVGCTSLPGSPERKSTCAVLRLVGNSLSVPQAIIFAERLERSDQEHYRQTYCLISP